jgi:hypothetical protein
VLQGRFIDLSVCPQGLCIFTKPTKKELQEFCLIRWLTDLLTEIKQEGEILEHSGVRYMVLALLQVTGPCIFGMKKYTYHPQDCISIVS